MTSLLGLATHYYAQHKVLQNISGSSISRKADIDKAFYAIFLFICISLQKNRMNPALISSVSLNVYVGTPAKADDNGISELNRMDPNKGLRSFSSQY